MDGSKTLNDIKSAGGWFVGEYAALVYELYEKLKNDNEYKTEFIKQIYLETGRDNDLSGTRTRVNSLMRIIQRHELVEALEYIIKSDNINKNDGNAVKAAKKNLAQIK